ncbi:MAG TPA: hypothetical protein VFR03_16890 [Thermoanaerobaculia bacterium]|nr:hypothetical protein [Thermoanaerobaculia bacterium]
MLKYSLQRVTVALALIFVLLMMVLAFLLVAAKIPHYLVLISLSLLTLLAFLLLVTKIPHPERQ